MEEATNTGGLADKDKSLISKLCNTPLPGHRLRPWRSPTAQHLRKVAIVALTLTLVYTVTTRKKKAAVAIVEENDLEWTAAVPFVDLATKPPPRERPVFGPVKCSNNRSTLNCIRWGDDVFVPFSFLKTEFELYGLFQKSRDQSNVFAIEHSKGKIHPPIEKYHALGIHLDDVYAFVEGRPWVIFVDGRQGVPLCRQWFPEGFFFSTNIAQFGLAHYSQYSVEPPPEVASIEIDGSSLSNWTIKDESSSIDKSEQQINSKDVTALQFKTTNKENDLILPFDDATNKNILTTRMFYITMDYKLTEGSSIVVHLLRKLENDKPYELHYICNDTSLLTFDNRIIIGLGHSDEWTRLTRNLYLDLEQGYNKKMKITDGRIHVSDDYITKITKVELRGQGHIHNITFTTNDHLVHFHDAAEWVLRNQDDKGGWPMPVKRPLGTDTLQPGWYTALGQGVCISLLARAYGVTKDERYLEAAMKGTKLFSIPSEDGGVKAVFMDKYVWYEEYPTQPPSFVLNGFILSLFGLYDLATTAPSPQNGESKRLYDEGITSLKAMLPLYDIGTRTVYDLRHYTMLTLPNVCRWDYHNLHVLLLNHLETIDTDPIFKEYGERWLKYKSVYKTPMDANRTFSGEFMTEGPALPE